MYIYTYSVYVYIYIYMQCVSQCIHIMSCSLDCYYVHTSPDPPHLGYMTQIALPWSMQNTIFGVQYQYNEMFYR